MTKKLLVTVECGAWGYVELLLTRQHNVENYSVTCPSGTENRQLRVYGNGSLSLLQERLLKIPSVTFPPFLPEFGAKEYHHMCRMDHDEIGHSTENEICPVCRMRNDKDASDANLCDSIRKLQTHVKKLEDLLAAGGLEVKRLRTSEEFHRHEAKEWSRACLGYKKKLKEAEALVRDESDVFAITGQEVVKFADKIGAL